MTNYEFMKLIVSFTISRRFFGRGLFIPIGISILPCSDLPIKLALVARIIYAANLSREHFVTLIVLLLDVVKLGITYLVF